VKWDVVASQFPREMLIVSDADMMARLPNGISLPLDEVIRQIPPDLFAIGGRAVDLHGLESFPAPFQPLVSDPGPPTPKAADSAPPVEPLPAPAVAGPQVVAEPAVAAPLPPPEAPVVATVTPAVVVEEPPVPEPSAREPRASYLIAAEPPRADGPTVPTAPLVTAQPMPEPLSVPSPEWPEPAAPEPEEASQPAAPIVAMAPEPLAVMTPPPAEIEIARVERSWRDVEPPTPTVASALFGMAETVEARRIVAMLAPIASFDVGVQSVEGVTVFAMAAPSVAQEIAVAGAGLAMSLFTDRRAPWSLDQITFRGPDTALVLTALGSPSDRGSVLATAVARGGGLALLEILCRRAAGDRNSGTVPTLTPDGPPPGRALVSSSSERLAGLASSLTAFGDVRASALRDAGGEGLLYLFLPGTGDVPGVGAIAQDVQAVMRKAAGSGAVFRTAVVRSGSRVLVIQPEEVGHGRSIIVVAGGEVTRPGLAYRQVERVTTALAQA
jgi:hypothetical protein